MNSLRLFTNAIKSHSNATINCVAKQRTHIEPRWYLKRSTADAFVRNATYTVGYSSDRSAAFFCGVSNRNCNQERYKWILSPHMRHASGIMINVKHYSQQNCNRFGTKSCTDLAKKTDAKSATISDGEADIFAESSKLGLVSRFRLITKMYWYILIPVHVVASAGWLCAFYYLSQCGVDFEALLQYFNLSENIAEKLQGSSLGHWAVVFLCYKIVTPARYAVTLGGTAVSIKYLVQRGYIKPMPTKDQLMQMIEAQKVFRGNNVEKGKNDGYIV